MKKIFSVLAVLLVATALFASVTVKVGGTFAFTDNKNVKFEDAEAPFNDGFGFKMSGYGFNIEVFEDVSNTVVAYSGVSMVFPQDATVNNGSEEFLLSKRVKDEIDDHPGMSVDYTLYHYSVFAGAAYKLDLNALKLTVGGGISYNRSVMILKYAYGLTKQEQKIDYFNIGLNALVEARFMFTRSIGISATAIPQIGLYNISKVKLTSSSTADPLMNEKARGFKVNFAVPVSVGVSFTF